jgi:hypothetical protein
MKKSVEDIKKIEEVLIAAHRMESNFAVTQGWQERVMEHIRQIAASKNQIDEDRVFSRIIWRFATAVSVFAGIFLWYVINTDINHESVMVNMFLNDPLNFIVLQIISP